MLQEWSLHTDGGSIFIAMLAAVFLWWFSTGAILLVVRLLENHILLTKLKVCIFSLPILALGLWGIWETSSSLTILGSYLHSFQPFLFGDGLS